MARTIYSLWHVSVGGKSMSIQQASYQLGFAPFFPPKMASLLWGLCFVLFWFGILIILYRRRIIIKV